jgi:hypothetical protein
MQREITSDSPLPGPAAPADDRGAVAPHEGDERQLKAAESAAHRRKRKRLRVGMLDGLAVAPCRTRV